MIRFCLALVLAVLVAPIAQAAEVKVISLTCHDTEDNLAPDEPVLFVGDVKVFGDFKLSTPEVGVNQTVQIDKTVTASPGVTIIKLYDFDYPDPSDFLGSTTVPDKEGEHELIFAGEGYKYSVKISVTK